jgi:rubrerythrin
MFAELRGEKEDLVKKREGLKAEYRAMPDSDPQKNTLWAKIRKIDQDLQTEYFKLLEDRGEEVPSVVKPRAPENSDLIRKQYKETIEEEEKRIQQIKDEYIEDDREFQEQERAIQEREAQIEQMEQEEYKRREAGTSGSCIPAAVKAPTGHKFTSGAVSGTDSESESEF